MFKKWRGSVISNPETSASLYLTANFPPESLKPYRFYEFKNVSGTSGDAVGTMTELRTTPSTNRGLIPGTSKGFSLLPIVHTGSISL